jgi:hypothetical protein
MKVKWKIKQNKSLRENAKLILPLMFDEMMSYKDKVILHPRLKKELHEMRIAGKPLRYAMEIFETSFGKQFKVCLEEVKHLIEQMGQIHDCDVNIPILQNQLLEIRILNQNLYKKEKILTKPIRDLIHELREKRNLKFKEICDIIEKWGKENFREKIIKAMT